MIGEQSFEGRRENLNQANKLSRTYSTLLEALNRHRGKGSQKVTVEHGHVHEGGPGHRGQRRATSWCDRHRNETVSADRPSVGVLKPHPRGMGETQFAWGEVPRGWEL